MDLHDEANGWTWLILVLINSAIVLEKVCEYFYYNEKYKDSKDMPDMEIPLELCLELLMAADYLNSMFFPVLIFTISLLFFFMSYSTCRFSYRL